MGAMQQMLVAMGGRKVVNIPVGAQNNYLANTAKVTGYQAGNTDVTFTVTGNIGSASVGTYAFTVDTSWNVNDKVNIVVNGGIAIVGRGGNGGNGNSYVYGSGLAIGGTVGAAAGPALSVQRATSITNNGTVSGGGGGGAGGSSYQATGMCSSSVYAGGGGGGGTGVSLAGAGGLASGGGTQNTNGLAGAPGALLSPGAGGAGGIVSGTCTPGGAGGTGGAVGATAGSAGGIDGVRAGGSAGACTSGNANITWLTTGTRLGTLG